MSYSATFARPTRPSIYVDGNVISRPVSDRAKRYKFALKIDIAAVVVLAIALIVCVVLPYVMPIDSTVKDGNFLYGIRYGGSDYYAYFLPTGTTPVKEGSISVDELDAEGEVVDSFRSHFEIGDSGVGEARIGSKTQGKLVLAGYSPRGGDRPHPARRAGYGIFAVSARRALLYEKESRRRLDDRRTPRDSVCGRRARTCDRRRRADRRVAVGKERGTAPFSAKSAREG